MLSSVFFLNKSFLNTVNSITSGRDAQTCFKRFSPSHILISLNARYYHRTCANLRLQSTDEEVPSLPSRSTSRSRKEVGSQQKWVLEKQQKKLQKEQQNLKNETQIPKASFVETSERSFLLPTLTPMERFEQPPAGPLLKRPKSYAPAEQPTKSKSGPRSGKGVRDYGGSEFKNSSGNQRKGNNQHAIPMSREERLKLLGVEMPPLSSPNAPPSTSPASSISKSNLTTISHIENPSTPEDGPKSLLENYNAGLQRRERATGEDAEFLASLPKRTPFRSGDRDRSTQSTSSVVKESQKIARKVLESTIPRKEESKKPLNSKKASIRGSKSREAEDLPASVEGTPKFKSKDEAFGTFMDSLVDEAKQLYTPDSNRKLGKKFDDAIIRKELEKEKRKFEKIPISSRVPSELSSSEPPDFTLSINSVKPIGAPRLNAKPGRFMDRSGTGRLKPVSDERLRDAQFVELIEQSNAAASLIQDEGNKNCWGCGVEFQSKTPGTLGYVAENVMKKYNLEHQLYQLKLDAQLKTNLEFETLDEAYKPTPEMLDLEKQITDLDRSFLAVATSTSQSKTTKNSSTITEMESKNPMASTVNPPERVLCERCFTLRNKSKATPFAIDAEYFKSIIKPIRDLKTRPLIVKIVDIFDFHGSFIAQYRKFIGNNRVLLVASKIDLLPTGYHESRIREWIYSECKKFDLVPVSVAMISQDGTGIRELADQIEFHREGANVYVIGSANVGKSTFINKLIDIFKGPKDRKATVSHVPGTTLNMLALPIGKSAYLYDTPGIITSKQIYHYLAPDELKMVLPKKQIKPSVYRLSPGSSLLIGGLARFDYLEGPNLVYFTLFASNELYIHKTSIDKAENLYNSHLGAMFRPPFESATVQNWPGLQPHEPFVIDNSEGNWQKSAADVAFAGIGWISVTMKGTAKVQCWCLPGCAVGLRPSLMPFESHLGILPNPRSNMKPSSISRGTRPSLSEEEIEHQDDA